MTGDVLFHRPGWRGVLWPLVLSGGFFSLVVVGAVLSCYVSIWPVYNGAFLVGVACLFLCIGPWLIFSWYLSLRVHALREGRYFHVGLAVFYALLVALSLSLLVFAPWNSARNGYFNTFQIWLGVLLVVLLLPSLAMELYKAATWADHWSTKNEMHCHAPSELLPHRPPRGRTALLLAGLLAAFALALLLVTLFPPQWNQIATHIHKQPSENAVVNVDVGIGTVWYIKLFPDQLVYWSWCLIVVLATVALLHLPSGRRLLHTPLRFDLVVSRLRLSAGELLLLLSFAGLVAWWLWYWSTGYTAMSQHQIHHGNEFGRIGQLPPLERAARALGHCNSLFISFLLLPLSRNSVWQQLFGVSYERAIRFHRWLGVACLTVTAAHMFTWWARWVQLDQLADQWSFHPNVIAPPCQLQGSCHNANFLLPYLFFAFLLLVLLAVLASEPVRRRSYELFYYSHHVGTYIYLLIALCHAWAMWNYLLCSGLLYLVDKCYRHVRSVEPVKLVSLTRTGDNLHSRLVLSRTSSPLSYSAGQFAWINIPAIDPYEWHPFSLVYHPDGYVQFVIKAIAYPLPTWTSKLLSMAASHSRHHHHEQYIDDTDDHHQHAYLPLLNAVDPSLEVYVDGPYGQLTRDPADYDIVLLVAGGIGVTPIFTLFNDLARNHADLGSCVLYWTAQSSALFDIFLPELEAVTAQKNNFHLVLSATREDNERIVSDSQPKSTRHGRINFEQEFRNIHKPQKSKVLVVVCGPQALVSSLQDLCADLEFDIHSEVFAF